ncbi:probable thiopurine S-methyltransferase isoform X1 [Apostichopus japonicus]|uniref:probable thiopurine S-methyltransferase isoform X1 n=1 Tax=Stichopus japonicus TaxID=307972 RepID=UPI003AB86CDB
MNLNNGHDLHESETQPNAKRQKVSHQSNGNIDEKRPHLLASSDDASSDDTSSKSHEETLQKNQFGDMVTDPDISTDEWVNIWKKGKTKFHKKDVHSIIKTYLPRLIEGKKNPTFLLPLCGKSVDMKWLLDQGLNVSGCEIAEEGVEQFFQENNIDFTVESLGGKIEGKLYKGKKLPVTIYVCDFFELPSVTSCRYDCVWDRGSLAAINTKDRSRYCNVMKKLLKADGRWLLDVFELDHVKFAGPPFNQDTEELRQLIGIQYDFEQLRRKDAMNPWSETWGVSYFIVKDFLIQQKSDNI